MDLNESDILKSIHKKGFSVMSRKRRNFSAKFKSDLVIEPLKGEKDLNTLATETIFNQTWVTGKENSLEQPYCMGLTTKRSRKPQSLSKNARKKLSMQKRLVS